MQRINHLAEFKKEWTAFLSQKGHKVTAPRGRDSVLQSIGKDGKGFRWLLFVTEAKVKTMTVQEEATTLYHMMNATDRLEAFYVVIRFMDNINKVLIVPADKVLNRKRILPRKGGIPWNR